jgi:hypothetical protein
MTSKEILDEIVEAFPGLLNDERGTELDVCGGDLVEALSGLLEERQDNGLLVLDTRGDSHRKYGPFYSRERAEQCALAIALTPMPMPLGPDRSNSGGVEIYEEA